MSNDLVQVKPFKLIGEDDRGVTAEFLPSKKAKKNLST